MTKAFHEFERAGWERAATHYDDAFGGVTAQTIRPLLAAVNARPGVRLLDVATGPGYVVKAASAMGADAVGIDFSTAMVALARQRNAGLVFEVGDAEALAFTDETFDSVTMNFGLLHLANPDSALQEACRVLVRGGRFAFTVWATPERSRGFGVVLRAIEAYGRLDVPLPEGPPFFRFSDADECTRSLKAAGFTDTQVVTLPLVWRMRSADEVFAAFSNGAVRTAALLRAQTPEALDAIRVAVHDDVEQYRRGDAIELAMAAVLASAAREAE